MNWSRTRVVWPALIVALTAWWMPPVESGVALSKDAYMRGMAAGCASEMVRLLNLGQARKAGFVSAGASDDDGDNDGGDFDQHLLSSRVRIWEIGPLDVLWRPERIDEGGFHGRNSQC